MQRVIKMNTRFRTNLEKMKALHHDKDEKMEDERSKKMGKKSGSNTKKSKSNRERKIDLLQDVDMLKKRLRHEENIHKALERAFTRPLGALPRLPPHLPPQILELLAEVAVLEEEVVWLEEQLLNFRQAVFASSNSIESGEQNPRKSLKHRRTKSMSQNEFNSETLTARFQPNLTRTASIRRLMSADIAVDRHSNLVHKPVNRKEDSRKSNYSSSSSHTEEKPMKKPPIRTHEMEVEQAHDCSSARSDESVSKTSPEKISEEILECLSSINKMATKSKPNKSEESEKFNQDFPDPYNRFPNFNVGPSKKNLHTDSVDLTRVAMKYLLGSLPPRT